MKKRCGACKWWGDPEDKKEERTCYVITTFGYENDKCYAAIEAASGGWLYTSENFGCPFFEAGD